MFGTLFFAFSYLYEFDYAISSGVRFFISFCKFYLSDLNNLTANYASKLAMFIYLIAFYAELRA